MCPNGCPPCLRTPVHHVSGLDTLKGEGENGALGDGMGEGVGGVGRGLPGRPLTEFGRRRPILPLPSERVKNQRRLQRSECLAWWGARKTLSPSSGQVLPLPLERSNSGGPQGRGRGIGWEAWVLRAVWFDTPLRRTSGRLTTNGVGRKTGGSETPRLGGMGRWEGWVVGPGFGALGVAEAGFVAPEDVVPVGAAGLDAVFVDEVPDELVRG